MKKYRWLGLLVGMSVIFLWWRHSSRNFHHIYMQSRTHQFEDVESVTIGTYNLKSLNMGESLEEAIVDLRAANLDIVCLQEVDEKSWRSHYLAMTKEIADALGYEYYAFFQTMFLGQGYYGIAIISRYPIMETSSQSLKVSLLKEPRVLAKAKIDVGKMPLNIYTTHLSFRPLEDKYAQMTFLQNQFKNCQRSVLLGDFNIFRDEDFFEIEGMTSVNNASRHLITFGNFGLPDNIYYSADLDFTNPDVFKTSFSDHHLLYGKLILEGEN